MHTSVASRPLAGALYLRCVSVNNREAEVPILSDVPRLPTLLDPLLPVYHPSPAAGGKFGSRKVSEAPAGRVVRQV